MGNSQKKENLGKEDYERFGNVTVNPTHENPTMQIIETIESEKAYDNWVKQIIRIEDSETQDTILLPLKHQFTKAGLCGSNGLVKITFDDFPFLLSTQVQNRKKLLKSFSEQELWYILYNLVRAANKFEKIKKKVGNIHPRDVVINTDGQIKVISTVSIPKSEDNFMKFVEDKNAKVYLAPQQLNSDQLQKGEYPTTVDPCRAEVFSIALTVISAGILEDMHPIYQGFSVNERLLNQYLELFRGKYSNHLFTTLLKMVIMQPENRRPASSIYNQLSPYEENILDLQPFFSISYNVNSSSFRNSSPPQHVTNFYAPQYQNHIIK